MNESSVSGRRIGLALSGVLVLGTAACSGDDGGSSAQASTSAASSSGGQAAPTQSAPSTQSSSASSSAPAPKETDPKKVLRTSEKSVRGSETVVLTLTSKDDGDGSDDDSFRAQTRGRVDGTNQTTTFDFEARGTFEVRIVDGAYYIKGDKAYWDGQRNLPAAERAKLPGKWVTVPQQHQNRFASQRIDRILASLQRDLDPAGATTSNTTIASTEHQGEPAYRLVRQDDDDPGDTDDEVTLLVEGDEKHLPLRATDDEDVMTFADWDTVDPITRPTGDTAPFPKLPGDDDDD